MKKVRDIRWAMRNGIDDPSVVPLPPGYKNWKDQSEYSVPGMIRSQEEYLPNAPPPVVIPPTVTFYRLLEDGSRRLLEDGSIRLLENG